MSLGGLGSPGEVESLGGGGGVRRGYWGTAGILRTQGLDGGRNHFGSGGRGWQVGGKA